MLWKKLPRDESLKLQIRRAFKSSQKFKALYTHRERFQIFQEAFDNIRVKAFGELFKQKSFIFDKKLTFAFTELLKLKLKALPLMNFKA